MKIQKKTFVSLIMGFHVCSSEAIHGVEPRLANRQPAKTTPAVVSCPKSTESLFQVSDTWYFTCRCPLVEVDTGNGSLILET